MAAKHSQLFPWYVGIAIIVAFEANAGGGVGCVDDCGPIIVAFGA